MRFIVEPKNTKAEVELQELLAKTNDFELISSYDPIESLSGKVEKLGVALRDFKKSGINWQVFTYYLRGRGLSNTIINNVMGKIDDFFEEAGIDLNK